MRKIFIVGILALLSRPAFALTCIAPGHPTCSMTCPGGCIAVYHEPNGPCRMTCSDTKGAKSAVEAAEASHNDLRRFLNQK
jgi:hypothetical protein